MAQITGLLGGRVSEELIFGSELITAGAHGDFRKISELVRVLIFDYGMSDLGIIPTRESLFRDSEIPEELPEKFKEKIANEREKIINQCRKKAQLILQKGKATLSLLANILLEKNSLSVEETNYIFTNQISPFVPLLN